MIYVGLSWKWAFVRMYAFCVWQFGLVLWNGESMQDNQIFAMQECLRDEHITKTAQELLR